MRVDIKNFDKVIDAPYIGRATVKIQGKPTLKTFNSGTVGLNVKFKIIDAVEQESGMDGLGKTFFDTLWIPHDGMKDGGKACEMTMRKFTNCFGVETDEDGFDLDELSGLEGDVIFVNKEEEYKGEKRMNNKISTYLKPTGGSPSGAPATDGWG